MTEAKTKQLILFYDGSCGFCNRVVQFVLKNEKKSTINFASLQSEFAINFLSEKGITIDLSTFYWHENGTILSQSSGFLALCKHLKFPWNWLLIGKIIPQKIRDNIYQFVARNRHKINSSYCNLPSAEDNKRFIS